MQSIYRFMAILVTCLSLASLHAQQTNATTIILLRHAEKDTVDKSDPILSTSGTLRAKSLSTVFKNFAPDEFYSTSYRRTQQTLMQWAELFGKEIKSYDPKMLEEFAAALKAMKGKTIVVADHSNTTPMLVNLLVGSSKYQPLDDSVYNKIFIVTILNNVVSDKVIEY